MYIIFLFAGTKLRVNYPVTGNYSQLVLSCTDGPHFISNATYFNNGTIISSQLLQQSISFSLTQDEEGEFSCGPSNGNMSPPVTLAGELDLWDIYKINLNYLHFINHGNKIKQA